MDDGTWAGGLLNIVKWYKGQVTEQMDTNISYAWGNILLSIPYTYLIIMAYSARCCTRLLGVNCKEQYSLNSRLVARNNLSLKKEERGIPVLCVSFMWSQLKEYNMTPYYPPLLRSKVFVLTCGWLIIIFLRLPFSESKRFYRIYLGKLYSLVLPVQTHRATYNTYTWPQHSVYISLVRK